ncbi:prolyl hydroxylase family protein [Chamaesiphon minutus]|uniref:Putative iron-regulated protein n=1 Tax=Chamaesiphon minutus (strain ATCC 27169 / PCC 6605) TaxID=1173020 RepID=K9UHX3_CHAP6|nr:2OG-Fe(II) oxygenase [Chamaesiphon minutus]AFY94056.1 putative iron-regulated protein [Chamaesiphon minutus PCC 6605]
MDLIATKIDDGIFTIDSVFSPGECQSLIDRAEAIGFEAATVRTTDGPMMMTNIRNNDRVMMEDPALASQMWQRIQHLLPTIDSSLPCSVDPQLRFYRYHPGQQFRRHKDGAVTNSLGQTSKLSYLIYLNDACEGGDTAFREYYAVDGISHKQEFIVTPTVGMALLFRHERRHEGTPVTAGVKYVLRSDVLYA